MSVPETIGVLAFNFERGVFLEEQLEFLIRHPVLDRIDILLANELDDGCSRSGNRNVAAEIASKLGMDYVFGLEFTELVGQNNQKGHHGNAIFSRWPILEAHSISLPVEYDWFFDAQKRTGGRQAILARLDVKGRQVGVVCTHLENRTTPEGRLRQLQFLLDAVEQAFPGLPVILGGDLNTCGFHGGDQEAMEKLVNDENFLLRHLSCPEELERCLCSARQLGFTAVPPLQAAGEAAITRRKPMPGGVLLLRVDWLLLRSAEALSWQVLSTKREECNFGPRLQCFAGEELSDHNVLWARVGLCDHA